MSTLTIHALDPATERRIRVKARKEKKSLNQLLKELLSGSVGVSISSRPEDHRTEFQEFSGIWSDKDVDEFNKAISDLERVDEKDWQYMDCRSMHREGRCYCHLRQTLC